MNKENQNETVQQHTNTDDFPDITMYKFVRLDEKDNPTSVSMICGEKAIVDTEDSNTGVVLGASCIDVEDAPFDFDCVNAVCALVDMLSAFPTNALIGALGHDGAEKFIQLDQERSRHVDEAKFRLTQKEWERQFKASHDDETSAVPEADF
ncbi:hypothetical protein [Bifidobacterium cuniculi]|uniref:Uncharacterized protein n=1 Tax=Bifidobacterium cuniculi TaxID=1688 RepID=A0A087B4Y1_9BIFI|nr:hypothetical protein [Bifidobacterium cuniculi]KFI66081.1 hypothetical protein BCUN_0583 [Bifidobacterium cuniculi]